jgi:competence protein ComFC
MEGSPHCTNCEGRTWHLSAIAAACRYEGLIRELIHRFKYGRDTTLAPLLGEILCGVTQDPRISGKQFDAIVPVPLHALREREREFNQAALLASFLSKRTSLPVKPLLKRFKNTPPQAGFDRALRMENLSGAFVLRGNVSVHASFLLVDDVTTTGSTLDACARLLREAGAAEVCAVSVARG